MSFWDGAKWAPEDGAAPAARPSRSTRPPAGIMVTLVVGVLLALPLGVFAASSSVWVVQLQGTTGTLVPTSSLHFGDAFDVGYKSTLKQPWGHAVCYADSTSLLSQPPAADGSIWGEWYSLWDGGPTPQHFVLGESVSPTWIGGGAECVVELVKVSGKYLGALGFTNETVLATTRFTVPG